MPVRIVKDDADESVLSDYFNFDNPQETESSNRQDNSWNGGSQNTSNATNGFFSFLGSMAVQACIDYAFSAFRGSSNKRQQTTSSFTPNNQMSYEDADNLLQERLASAELCVSLWAHTAFADGKMQQVEKEALNRLIQDTVSKLFPQDIADQTKASSILQIRLKEPFDYQTVVNEASKDHAFAVKLYQQACLLIAADEVLQDGEQVFLKNLARDLRLESDDVAKAHKQFNLL